MANDERPGGMTKFEIPGEVRESETGMPVKRRSGLFATVSGFGVS